MRRAAAIDEIRATVDANIFVSGLISPVGRPALVVERLIRGDFALVSTEKLRQEVDANTERIASDSRYRITSAARHRVLHAISNAIQTPPDELPPVRCRDPKDDYLLACAVAGTADYLVTGDRDLLALDGDPALGALRILTPLDFLAALDARESAQ